MSPPPVTPTPHRFVTTAKDPKQPPLLHAHQSSQARASQQQFAPTPRFSFTSLTKHTSAGDPSQSSSSPFIPRRLLQQPSFSRQKGEDIEEASSDSGIHEASTASDPFIHNAPDITQGTTTNASSAFPSLPNIKRRRLIPPTPHEPISISSSPPPSSPPSTPPRPATPPSHHTLPRFIPAPPPSPSLPTRPHFLLPPSPPPPPPIPQAFSPHRRNAKYIPAGLAATVLELVLEASQASHNHARARSATTWDITVVVEECSHSERMLLVRERETGRGWVFAGSGGVVGERMESGCVIGVRRPVWEVEVGEERWGVGAEWRVLGEG